MIERVEGIIISEKNYGETSKIIDVITKEHGKVSMLVKGARSLKSSFRSSSTKLTYVFLNINYKEGHLSTLMEIDVINYYKNIKKDIVKISYASYLLELVEQVISQTNTLLAYQNLIDALDKIDVGFDPLVITNILELKCLSYLGVMPVLDCCSICGNSNVVTISLSAGGFICRNCRNTETIVLDKTIKLIRLFFYVDIAKICKITVSKRVSDEINYFLTAYYEMYTGLYLRSKKFIDKLNKVGELC